MTKQIITCTGYGGTGSSAITDLLKEFDNGLSLGDAEFWFLQDYDGISDLEYFLIDGNHRSKVYLAIKKFKEYISNNNQFYTKYFNDKFIQYSDEYIEAITDAKFKKALSSFEVDNKIYKLFIFNFLPKIQLVIKKLLGKNTFEFSPYIPQVEKFYTIPNKDKFYKETKKYTTSLFDLLDKENQYDFIAVDQLVPTSNIKRYFNYVDNLKVIVVDRDPRDLYLLNETHWNGASYICNTSNIEEYINWYQTMREYRQFEEENENILYIMLEELIYEYDIALEKIYNFLEIGVKNHTNKQQFFNPNISIKYTKLYVKYPEYNENIKIIKEKLSKYCYNHK